MAEHVCVLLVKSCSNNQGGVANYYKTILPYIESSEFRVKIIEVGSPYGKKSVMHFVTDQIRFVKALSEKPDLVHINPSLGWKSFLRDGIFAWNVKRKGLPLLVFYHGWNKEFELIVESYLKWFFRITLCRADGFIVLANEFKKKLLGWGVRAPVELGSTVVADYLLESFDYEKKLLDLSVKSKIKVLFLARLERGKGIYETVDAINGLVEKGLPVSLSIAGDGSIINELRSYVGRLCLPPGSIEFLGYVSGNKKIRTFVEHDIYCLPSYGEGLPISILEAMVYGLPVITCSVGGLVDMFKDGEMGFVVKKGDFVDVEQAIGKLIMDRVRMVQMSKYNHYFAAEHFVPSVVAKHLLDIYRMLIGGIMFSKIKK